MSARFRFGRSLLVAALFLLGSGFAGLAERPTSASAKLLINAPAHAVFQAIRQVRNSPPLQRKLISYDGKVAMVKETLKNEPVLGDVECVWKEVEQPDRRIDYTMVGGTKLKSASGSYVLTPSADGRTTTLELSSQTVSGVHLPFAGTLEHAASMKSARTHLLMIKNIAESKASAGGGKTAGL